MQPDDKQRPLGRMAILGRFAAIGTIVCGAALLFIFVGGWLSPRRLTQDRFMAAFEAHDGKHPGFRRNHAKGVCVTGWFDAAPDAATWKAAIFHLQHIPIVGRFALAGGMPFAADQAVQVRSMALRIQPIGGEEWRTGMNDIPVFAVNSNEGFYGQLLASAPDPATGKPNPDAMKGFLDHHPETARAMQLIKARPISSGFADDTYNSLNAFYMTDTAGVSIPVRWAAVPLQPFLADDAEAHGASGQNYLFDELTKQIALSPLKWQLVLTLGEAGDSTQDATLPWPKERRHTVAGMVTIVRAMSEEVGACSQVNYDPLVVPDGISASDDPLLAARSSSYARSFTLRSAEKAEKPPSAVVTQDIGGSRP